MLLVPWNPIFRVVSPPGQPLLADLPIKHAQRPPISLHLPDSEFDLNRLYLRLCNFLSLQLACLNVSYSLDADSRVIRTESKDQCSERCPYVGSMPSSWQN